MRKIFSNFVCFSESPILTWVRTFFWEQNFFVCQYRKLNFSASLWFTISWNLTKISAFYLDKQKSFVPKKKVQPLVINWIHIQLVIGVSLIKTRFCLQLCSNLLDVHHCAPKVRSCYSYWSPSYLVQFKNKQAFF